MSKGKALGLSAAHHLSVWTRRCYWGSRELYYGLYTGSKLWIKKAHQNNALSKKLYRRHTWPFPTYTVAFHRSFMHNKKEFLAPSQSVLKKISPRNRV